MYLESQIFNLIILPYLFTSLQIVVVSDKDSDLIEAEYKVLFLKVGEACLYSRSYYSFITTSFVRQVPRLMKSNFLQINKEKR